MVGKEPIKSRDELLKERKKIISSFVLLLTAFVSLLIAIGSWAWFASNKEVIGDEMKVSMAEMPFELAVPDRTGADTRYNDLIEELGYSTTRDTTEGGSIRWVMKDEDPNIGEDYRGFRPGSYGTLTFYILPKSDNDTLYHLRLDMTGYYAEFESTNGDPTNLSDQIADGTFKTMAEMAENDNVSQGDTSLYSLAADYLKGHILFYQNRKALSTEELGGTGDSNLYYYDRITDSFTYDISEHEATQWNGRTAYEVVIYWIWPNTFSQILLENDDESLEDKAMFSSKQSADPSPREELMVDIAQHPANYFHSSALTEMSSEDLSTLMGSDSLHYTNALITLNNGYNGADQVIGENVQFLLVELTASQD